MGSLATAGITWELFLTSLSLQSLKKCNHLVWYNLVYDTIPLLKKEGEREVLPLIKRGGPLPPTYGQVWLSAMKQQMSLYHRFDTIFMYDWFVVKIILGTRTSSLQKNEQFQIKKKGGREYLSNSYIGVYTYHSWETSERENLSVSTEFC